VASSFLCFERDPHDLNLQQSISKRQDVTKKDVHPADEDAFVTPSDEV
jgi:hypothetical protein